MELLEAREDALRRRVVGAAQARGGSFGAQTVVDRVRRVNAQLEQLNATIAGFARLTELYHANRSILQLHRSSTDHGGEEVKRAVILSSEDQIAGVVAEFQRLQELQRYVTQLEQLHANSAHVQSSLDGIELTHAQQQERALVLHARVEKILGIYQETVQVLSEKCVEYSAVLDQLLPNSA